MPAGPTPYIERYVVISLPRCRALYWAQIETKREPWPQAVGPQRMQMTSGWSSDWGLHKLGQQLLNAFYS